MDFNDEGSIYSNSQMALNIQNISQNDYLQANFDDNHMLHYYMNDDSSYNQMLNVQNQCETSQNILCQSNQSNPLKQTNTIHHPPQPHQLNRSRLDHPQHPSYQQPSQSHNNQSQFHNPQSTSKQFLSSITPQPIQNQTINYVNIPNHEVANHNVLNNPNCVYNNKKDPNLYQLSDNSMLKDNSFHQNGINHASQIQHSQQRSVQTRQLILTQQQPQNDDLIKAPNNNLINKSAYTSAQNNISPNSLTPPINKNVNTNLINNNSMHSKEFYHSSQNYFNHTQKQVNGNISGNHLNSNYFNNTTANETTNHNLVSQQIVDNNSMICGNLVDKIPENNLNNKINLNNSLNNNNNSKDSISSNSQSKTKSTIIYKNKKNELNDNNLTIVDLNKPKTGSRMKAETKTIIIFKVIDQIILNGEVVKETVVKNDEIVKNTGFIDWPSETKQQTNSSSRSPTSTLQTMTNGSDTNKNDKNSSMKKAIKVKKNLKRGSANQIKESRQEKKLKTEVLDSTKSLKIDSTKLVSKKEIKLDEDNGFNDKKNEKINETVTEKIIKISSILKPSISEGSIQANTKLDKKQSEQEEDKIDELDKKDKSDKKEILEKAENKKSFNKIDRESKIEKIDKTEKLIKFDKIDTKQQDQIASPSTTKTTASLTNYVIEDPIFKVIDLDQKVLAKWSDKNFYSGTVISKENDGKWGIGFDDGGKRLVRENEIISVEFLPKGQQVMVNYSAGFCAKGLIKSYRFDETNSQTYYLIEYVVGIKYIETEYNAKDVFLTGDSALSLLNRRKQNINDTKFADVDLNNIIPKRSRVSNKNLNDSTSSNTSETTGIKTNLQISEIGELELMDNDSNSNLSCSTSNSSITTSSSTKKSSKKTKSIKQHNALSLNTEDTFSDSISQFSLSNSLKSSNLAFENKKEAVNEELNSKGLGLETNNSKNDSLKNDYFYDNLIGPILPQSSNLFRSYHFLLSFDDEKQNDQVAGFSIPFDVDHIRKQIKSGNGLILDNFEDIKENYQVVLVSHSYLKTVKYLMCLSTGIPCVKFTWIIDSCKKNELLKKEPYILPTGYSIITNNLLQDRNIYKKSQTLFKGTKIYLISSLNSELTSKWMPLFNASKAVMLDHLPDTSRKSNCADLIVSDQTCPEEVIKKASLLKIPIVSINYIIECLIHGKRLSVDAHPTFHYSCH